MPDNPPPRHLPRPHQTATPDDFTNSGEDLGQYLGPIYKDEIAGIKIAPPVGSRIINRAGLDLVSFVQDAKQWGGSVQMVILKEKVSMEGYLSSIAAELSRTFRRPGPRQPRTHLPKPPRRPNHHQHGSRIRHRPRPTKYPQGRGRGGWGGQSIALFRQQLIVQLADNQLIVLTFYVPLKDREAATTTFDAMLSTFELLDRQELAKHRAAAVELGKNWLAQRSADELKAKLNPQPQLFRMKSGGTDIGFLQFNEVESTRENTKGIRVLVTSRGFKPDGANVAGQFDAYWSYAGDTPPERRLNYSAWENITKTVLNRPDVPLANQTFWLREIGTVQMEGISRFTDAELADLQKQRDEMLKNKDLPADKIPPPIDVAPKLMHIHVVYDGDRSQPPLRPFDGSISLDHPAVLPAVLDYLWPRTVDLTKKCEMTFVVYNSALKKLTYRTLSVIGKDHVVLNKKPTDCFRCLDEMDPASTTLWVDQDGKILMMRTSDQSLLLPTTEPEMQRLWAGRLNPPH